MRLSLPSFVPLFLLSLSTLAACASDDTPLVTGAERAEFKTLTCDTPLVGLASQLKVGGLQLTSTTLYITDSPLTIEATDGKPCGGQLTGACAEALTDRPDCASGMGLVRSEGPWSPGTCERIVSTTGDQATVIVQKADLLTALAPIDSLEKLRLQLRYEDDQLACKDARAVEGGFEVLVEDYNIQCGETEDRLYFVAADGSITVRRSANHHKGEECEY